MSTFKIILERKWKFRLIYLASALASILLASGCSLGGKSDPSKFYVLDSQANTAIVTNLTKLQIGVGPIEIPGYIDRPQMVTKSNDVEITLDEYSRWAEPMDEMFPRVLTQNIRILGGSNQIHSFPWTNKLELDFQVTVKIIKFENDSKGDALLITYWQLEEKTKKYLFETYQSEFHAKAASNDYSDRVVALNKTIEQFAHEIVTHISQDN